jgi:hypothetical protein
VLGKLHQRQIYRRLTVARHSKKLAHDIVNSAIPVVDLRFAHAVTPAPATHEVPGRVHLVASLDDIAHDGTAPTFAGSSKAFTTAAPSAAAGIGFRLPP